MSKDSQMDPAQVRKAKAKGGQRINQSELDGKGRNEKKKSGNKNDV